MDPVLSTVIGYVCLKFVDQFIKDEGYGRFKKWLFPKEKYKNRLIEITHQTIDEFEKLYPYDSLSQKFPFYHSQILFEELNKYILFKKSTPDYSSIINTFKSNTNIIIPTTEELSSFYKLFSSKVNADNKLKSLFIEENYQSKIFDLASNLERIEIKIDSISTKLDEVHSVLVFNPDSNWFKNQCERAIIDLGKRYTPELNFELDIKKIFDGLGRTTSFKQEAIKLLDAFLINGKKVLNDKEEIKEKIKSLENDFDKLFNLFSSIDFENNLEIPLAKFEAILESINTNTEAIRRFYTDEERKLQEEKKDYNFYHKYGSEIRDVRKFRESISAFENFLNDNACKLANNPFLVIDGEAGIGKSHMLGDVVSMRIKHNYESIFLLGQHFNSDESPWIQIFKRLQINTTSDKFLETLNQRAKDTRKRIIIFIDAINEGRGKYFWNENIKGFIDEIRSYEFLGLVLSIRSSYKAMIFPADEIAGLNIIEQTLYGFSGNEYEASKLFFKNYNIQLPNVPLLHPEFQNPLFLKLFCEGINKSGQNKIPDGIQGISAIINFFVKNVNTILSKPNRFDYSNGLNLVDRSVSAIIQYKIDHDLNYVPYEKAIEIVEEVVSKFITKRGTYLDELISEGIFSKNLFWKKNEEYEEGIYLAYERFEDHLLCKHLLERYPDIESEFKEGGNLFKYIEKDYHLHQYKGLIDAFSIQIPETHNKEFYEIVPHLKDNYDIIESFVGSLLWRKYETIRESSQDYVNGYVLKYRGTYELFWEILLSVASIPEHYYNANSLHSYLMQFSMADRDAEWTQNLKYKYSADSAVRRLIDWAWNEDDKAHISDESIKLSGIAMAWFLTSTNRQLRDCATKALVSLLQNRINVLIEVLRIFEGVNDPYVYERLFAVAYGCALRTDQHQQLVQLSEYIYETIFNVADEVYPHILLRDYARGVIEYTNYSGKILDIDLAKIRPPYRSSFNTSLPSDEETDSQYDPKEEGYYGKPKWGISAILMSMGVEHGRRSYGDFGRYTFQSGLRRWNVDTNGLSNLAIKWIIDKYGYDPEKHSEFDAKIGTGRGNGSTPNERIGKKYQWLAFYEILARVSDNYKKYEEYDFNHENEELYDGPWSPYIRDIDPTILIKKTGEYDEEKSENFWWNDKNVLDWSCLNIDWVKTDDDLPKIESLIEVIDNDNEAWLVLEGYPEWAEPKKIGEEKWDQPHKRLWCHIRSYIVSDEDFEKLKNWAVQQDYMGRWMPESRDRYEIYTREYYWSPTYKYFQNEYYGGESEREIRDKETGEFIANVTIPVESYRWEEEFDKSKEATIGFMKPSSVIFNGMNLLHSPKEGEFLNHDGQVVCFATNVHHNSKSYFLIRKKPFLDYLKENKLNILWTVLGEKQVIGGRTFRENYIGILEFSGAYYLTENKLKGVINLKQR